MDEKIKLVGALVAIVIFGALVLSFFTSVPKSTYEELKTACDSAKADAASQLSAEKGKSSFTAQSLADCVTQKKGGEELLAARNAELEGLRAKSAILSAARVKADAHQQYVLLLQYYNDGFGPNSVLNNEKMGKIQAQLTVVGDADVTGFFNSIRSCSTLLGCQSAKSNFINAAEQRMGMLANETTEIVKSS
ncbi:MAG: hypothetical protein NTV88_04330 [Candidatus Micrarchaeota archaeon]|nr:hypothetical protein [Candidatus Micrarchaeota archaeon]